MSIILIRHTSVNIEKGTIYGDTDIPLSDTFNDEAKQISQKLSKTPINMVYSSPLTRCKQLAKALFGTQEIFYDDRLKELNFGQWEMKKWDDIYQTPYAEKWFESWQDMPCPEGESNAQLMQRVTDCYEEIRMHTNMAIVTHGGPIKALLAHIQNADITEQFNRDLPFGSVIKIDNNSIEFL